MKMTPVVGAANAAPQAPDAPSTAQKVRSLRMSTNATPGYDPLGLATPPADPPPTDPKLATTDTGETPPSEATEPLSPQYAALARQKRALQVKERELADREKALQAQPPAQGDQALVARLKSEPLAVLLENGVTYQQLTEAIMANPVGAAPEVLELRQQINDLKKGVDDKLAERDAQTEQSALAEMQREALQIVAEGDEFEVVRSTKSVPKVIELIKRTYHDTGEVLDVKEALGLVENELVEQGLKMAGAKKVRERLGVPQPSPTAPQRQAAPTLTNRDTAQVPMTNKQRALAAFHGTLKR